MSEEIGQMRLQYYEEKRRAFTLQLEDTVKRGMIDAVKNDEVTPIAMNRTIGGS